MISSKLTGEAVAFNVTAFAPISNTNMDTSTTETDFQITYNVGGLFSNLFVFVFANTIATSATTVNTRKNATSDGTCQVSIAAGATGIFEDIINTDTVTSGDEWCYEITTPNTSGSITFLNISIIFAATTNTYELMSAISVGQPYTDATVYYQFFIGSLGTNTTETSSQQDFLSAGTLKHGYCVVTANTVSNTYSIKTRKNAVSDGNIAISITADSTGTFEDTSNTDIVADGDDWCWTIPPPTEAGTNTTTITMLSIGFETTNSQHILSGMSTSFIVSFNLTRYLACSGPLTTNSTETRAQTTSRLSNAVAKELQIEITANTIATDASTLTFRQNETTDTLTVSIAAGATGVMSTTGTTTIASTDEINYKLVTPNTSGSLTIQQLSSLIDCTAAAAGFVHSYGVIIA